MLRDCLAFTKTSNVSLCPNITYIVFLSTQRCSKYPTLHSEGRSSTFWQDSTQNLILRHTKHLYLISRLRACILPNLWSFQNIVCTKALEEHTFFWPGAVKKDPIVVGKPAEFMLANIAEAFKLERNQICMVGDRLDTDVLFGKDGGLTTLLVLTGKFSLRMLWCGVPLSIAELHSKLTVSQETKNTLLTLYLSNRLYQSYFMSIARCSVQSLQSNTAKI